MTSKTQEEWVAWGKKHHRFLFFYTTKALDLTDFMAFHPGGKKALINYVNKDITDTIFKVFPHRKETTINVLFRYVVGNVIKREAKQERSRCKTPTIIDYRKKNIQKEKKKVSFENVIVGSFLQKNDKESKDRKINPTPLKNGENIGNSGAVVRKEVSLKLIEEVEDQAKMQKYIGDTGTSTKQLNIYGQIQAASKNDISLTDLEQIEEQASVSTIPTFEVKNRSTLYPKQIERI